MDLVVRAAAHLSEVGAGALVVLLPPAAGSIDAIRRLMITGCDDVLVEDDHDLPRRLARTVTRLRQREQIAADLEAGGLLGHSAAIRRVRSVLAQAALDRDLNVLLLGETGVGKYVAARALHNADPNHREHPFHAFDCGSVTEGLFGSELFGHVRGAFTGAVGTRQGAIATAGAGTLLLDEIGELRPELQASFLSALQERRFRAVGADHDQPIRSRIISATNRDLPTLVASGQFRADLFYRLDGLRVYLPALRERADDIPVLFRSLVQRYAVDASAAEVDPGVFDVLATLPLPGNVRQLEAIARLAVRRATGDTIRTPHLPLPTSVAESTTSSSVEGAISNLVRDGKSLEQIIGTASAAAVKAAIDLAALGTSAPRTELVRRAARQLKVSERTVYNRLRDRLESPPPRPTDRTAPLHLGAPFASPCIANLP
ncbi:MAG: sigma 54-interacting transcriptional regulator [Gemmatimonadales bacterium]